MNPGAIWWGQIGNSLRFLTNVTNHLRDCQSAVLQVPQNLPWRKGFYEAIDIRRTSFGSERRMVRLSCQEGMDPGAFVLDELCSKRVRADYWPGQTYAEYLGAREDIVLNDYYVWITGIHRKTELAKWTEFVSQYKNAAKHIEQSAVFLLEYDGVPVESVGVERIPYTVEDYDCRVFCLEAAATLNSADLRGYQAELALRIARGDPEICAALLTKGSDLLEEPVKTAQSVLQSGYYSEGFRFPDMTQAEIESAVWKASIVSFFPVLEQYRSDFIAQHKGELIGYLPISNSNGDQITDPQDLEIGLIQYIVSNAKTNFSAMEAETLNLCRKVRNLLAHNKTPSYSDIAKFVALKTI